MNLVFSYNLVAHSQTSAQAGKISLRILLLVFLLACLVPLALVGWRELYQSFLERQEPEIVLLETPRGIGITPVSLRVRFEDDLSGLDEIVIRAKQRRRSTEIVRKKLAGVAKEEITLEFDRKDSGFEEGELTLEIRAFDRSMWSNGAEKEIVLRVDFKRPQLEVISTQHNARRGGSQLIFYTAEDENLALSGVKVGPHTFIGFPARRLDGAFESVKDLYVALYAIPLDIAENPRIRLFAEDRVGNTKSSNFHNRILPRRVPRNRINLSEQYLDTTISRLLNNNYDIINQYQERLGIDFKFDSTEQSQARLIENFKLVNGVLREITENRLQSYLAISRYDFYWDRALLPQNGVVLRGFGEELGYFFNEELLGQELHTGFIYAPRSTTNKVIASGSGVVMFSEELGLLGSTIGIDHGLGLASIYSWMGLREVQKGTRIQIGENLGQYGESGFAAGRQLLFQTRVHGIPVDPTEWLSRSWYQSHVSSKIDEAKRSLGIPVRLAF